MENRNAVAILSGGLDSATALAITLDRGTKVEHALWFGYGQRHEIEQASAVEIANHYDIHIDFVHIPDVFASNQLTDPDQTPRANVSMREITDGVAPTFVPGRNMVMLALATSYAVAQGCDMVVGGWHWDDSSGYPDCRSSFLVSMSEAIKEAFGRNITMGVSAPLISMSKGQIVSNAVRLQVPINRTWSCYNPDDAHPDGPEACGECDTCQLRIKGFKDAGFIDPVPYAKEIDWGGCDPIGG